MILKLFEKVNFWKKYCMLVFDFGVMAIRRSLAL